MDFCVVFSEASSWAKVTLQSSLLPVRLEKGGSPVWVLAGVTEGDDVLMKGFIPSVEPLFIGFMLTDNETGI